MEICLLENDDMLRKLIRTILERNGATVRDFKMPSKALSFLKSDKNSDILIMNGTQSELSVPEIIKIAKKTCPEIGIICISGFPSNKDICIQSGCDVFIPKLIDINQFWQEIVRFYEWKRAE